MVGVRVLGRPEVEVDGRLVPPPRSRRAWSLLGWLALHPGQHSRSSVASVLWPDVLDTSALKSLRSALWALRKALGAEGERALVAARDRVGLDSERAWVDAAEFDALVRAGRLEEAYRLCRGELLEGIEDDWAVPLRDAHRDRVRELLRELSERAGAAGDRDEALRWARLAAALDPLSEEGARLLMVRLADAGDRPAALAVYGRLSERLRRELRVAPSAETRQLAEQLRAPEPRRATHAPRRSSALGPRRLPLVGRAAELETLVGAWRSARAGHGASVIVRGPAGIGKTRLVAELAEIARGDDGLVVGAAAPDLGGPAPFALWAELAGELVRALSPPPPGLGWPADLARVVPVAAAWAYGDPLEALASPTLERTRLLEAAVCLVEHAASEAALLMLLEDVHAADTSSLELAAYVARRLPALPVLAVLTRREPWPRSELAALEHSLVARGSLVADVELEPLAQAELEALVAAVAELPDEAKARIVGAAEGNPLLAVEAARALARGDESLPAGLRGAVRASLGALAATARGLAEAMAVAGRDLAQEEARALMQTASVETYSAALGAAEAAGLLVSGGGRVGYRHALLREAVYEDLPEPIRASLHERLAELSLAKGDAGAAEAARHLRLAGRGAEAVEQLRRAAAHARSVAALEEAQGFLGEALVLQPDDAGLVLELAEAQISRGGREDSDRTFARALELLERSGDTRAIADAHFRRGRWHYSHVCVPRVAQGAFRRGLDLLESADDDAPDERWAATAAVAWGEAIGGDPDAADALLDELERQGPPPDDLAEVELGRARAASLIRRGRFEESYAHGVAAARVAERAARPDVASGCWQDVAGAATCAGDLTRALGYLDRCLAAMRRHRLLATEAQVLCARAWVLARQGRHAEADREAVAAAEISGRIGADDLRAAAENERARIAMLVGSYEGAEALFRSALAAEGPFSRPLARLGRAEALARLGRCDEAEHELRAAAQEPVSAGDWPDTLVARMTRVQGLIAAARGDLALAARRLEEAAAGWRRRVHGPDGGERWAAALADLGRPVVGVVEPDVELALVEADLRRLEEATVREG